MQHDQLACELLAAVFACSPDVAQGIAGRAADRRFPARAVIVRQGESADETFLLISGRARALHYGGEGQFVVLYDYGPGDLFGALLQLDAVPHQADVETVEAARAALFAALDFVMLAERHSCIGLAVSRILFKRLQETTGRMLERTTLSAAGRVHAELLRLARVGDGRTIRPAPVLAALAVKVLSTRETVSRTISALERRGIVRRQADALVIVAPHRLEELIV